MSLKEKPKPKSHSKLNKWFKQANRNREQHPSVENTVTYAASTPEIASHYSRDQRCHYRWDPRCHLNWYSYIRRN